MTNRTALIIGGTSDVGRAIATEYATRGWNIVLAARNEADAERNASDLRVRYNVDARVVYLELFDTQCINSFWDLIGDLPETVVCVVGYLGNQKLAEKDVSEIHRVFMANFEAPAKLLMTAADKMIQRGGGTIVALSSVAGDRGRGSNFVYGSAKAGLTAFLSGLRNLVFRNGVRVLTVKPGFIRTRMTQGMSLPALLTAEPNDVARAVYRAAELRKRDVIYVRVVWWSVMAVIRNIPEPLFKRLRL